MTWKNRIAAALTILSVQAPCLDAARAQHVEDRPHAGEALAHIVLVKNKSKNIKISVPFADATVGSTEIADIVPISDRQLYILGKKVGTTNILLYDKDKQLIGVVDIVVKTDTAALSAQIQAASGAPAVQVKEVEGKLVVGGNGVDAPTAERAMSIATSLGGAGVVNAMRMRPNQQVMVKVRFVEANRGAVRALGVRWSGIINNRAAGVVGTSGNPLGARFPQAGLVGGAPTRPGGPIVPGAATGPLVLDALGMVGNASPVASILAQIVNTGSASLDAMISAMEDQGVLRRLAEPNLVALSGEEAEFLAGGEFPVPVAQSSGGIGVAAPITVQWKEYGVKLKFTPTVLTQNVISLKLAPEVSDLDPNGGTVIQGTAIPGLITRRSRTTVELRDGQTFAISGLIQTKSVRDLQAVPWLGSVPVLGALFRSTEFQAQETELVALVTPYIVRPVAPEDPRLKTPLESRLPGNDVDMFLGGQLEVAKTPPTYVTPTGAQQPVAGGMAPGAPQASPVAPPLPEPVPAAAGPDPIQQFISGLFAAPAAGQP